MLVNISRRPVTGHVDIALHDASGADIPGTRQTLELVEAPIGWKTVADRVVFEPNAAVTVTGYNVHCGNITLPQTIPGYPNGIHLDAGHTLTLDAGGDRPLVSIP